jgi:hypothetical protein
MRQSALLIYVKSNGLARGNTVQQQAKGTSLLRAIASVEQQVKVKRFVHATQERRRALAHSASIAAFDSRPTTVGRSR